MKEIIEIQKEIIKILKEQSAYTGKFELSQLESELASLEAEEEESGYDTKELLADIISWELDLSEYSSLESILNAGYIIQRKKGIKTKSKKEVEQILNKCNSLPKEDNEAEQTKGESKACQKSEDGKLELNFLANYQWHLGDKIPVANVVNLLRCYASQQMPSEKEIEKKLDALKKIDAFEEMGQYESWMDAIKWCKKQLNQKR